MLDILKIVTLSVILSVALMFPFFETEVTISLPITENRPFAGVVNGEFVGTDVSCKYWLSKEKMDSVMTWRVSYSLMCSLGVPATAERID